MWRQVGWQRQFPLLECQRPHLCLDCSLPGLKLTRPVPQVAIQMCSGAASQVQGDPVPRFYSVDILPLVLLLLGAEDDSRMQASPSRVPWFLPQMVDTVL